MKLFLLLSTMLITGCGISSSKWATYRALQNLPHDPEGDLRDGPAKGIVVDIGVFKQTQWSGAACDTHLPDEILSNQSLDLAGALLTTRTAQCEWTVSVADQARQDAQVAVGQTFMALARPSPSGTTVIASSATALYFTRTMKSLAHLNLLPPLNDPACTYDLPHQQIQCTPPLLVIP
jgi:hypothetical protein